MQLFLDHLSTPESDSLFFQRCQDKPQLVFNHFLRYKQDEGDVTWWVYNTGEQTPRPDDLSHSGATAKIFQLALEKGWCSEDLVRRVSDLFKERIWKDSPSRIADFVDGRYQDQVRPDSSSADVRFSRWKSPRYGSVGWSQLIDLPPGYNQWMFEYIKSLLISSYLLQDDLPLKGTPDINVTVALATLLERRPACYKADSKWSVSAGDARDNGDGSEFGSVRFYNAAWGDPTDHIPYSGGLTLKARGGQGQKTKFQLDLPNSIPAETDVVISLTYANEYDGEIRQWNGSDYIKVAELPKTLTLKSAPPREGPAPEPAIRWWRHSFLLNRDVIFDYGGVPGCRSILFELRTTTAWVHRIEATPLIV